MIVVWMGVRDGVGDVMVLEMEGAGWYSYIGCCYCANNMVCGFLDGRGGIVMVYGCVSEGQLTY